MFLWLPASVVGFLYPILWLDIYPYVSAHFPWLHESGDVEMEQSLSSRNKTMVSFLCHLPARSLEPKWWLKDISDVSCWHGVIKAACYSTCSIYPPFLSTSDIPHGSSVAWRPYPAWMNLFIHQIANITSSVSLTVTSRSFVFCSNMGDMSFSTCAELWHWGRWDPVICSSRMSSICFDFPLFQSFSKTLKTPCSAVLPLSSSLRTPVCSSVPRQSLFLANNYTWRDLISIILYFGSWFLDLTPLFSTEWFLPHWNNFLTLKEGFCSLTTWRYNTRKWPFVPMYHSQLSSFWGFSLNTFQPFCLHVLGYSCNQVLILNLFSWLLDSLSDVWFASIFFSSCGWLAFSLSWWYPLMHRS